MPSFYKSLFWLSWLPPMPLLRILVSFASFSSSTYFLTISVLLYLPFSLSIMSLGNPNYSRGFNCILKNFKSLFRFLSLNRASTMCLKLNFSSHPPPLQSYSLSVFYHREWYHYLPSWQSQNLGSHFFLPPNSGPTSKLVVKTSFPTSLISVSLLLLPWLKTS